MKKIGTLKKNYEFKNVMNKGKYCCGKFITVYINKNKIEKNVIGIAISTKVAKAVKRNRIKRLIRENYRIKKENLKQGNNIVFLWNQRSPIESANFHNIGKDMNIIFDKLDLLIKK